MSFRIARDDDRRRVVITLADVVTVDLMFDYVYTLVAERLWSWPSIVDASGARGANLTREDVKRYTLTLAQMAPRGPVAIVAPLHPLCGEAGWHTNMATLMDRVPRRVVRTIEEGHAWLDSLGDDPGRLAVQNPPEVTTRKRSL
jgi:hypothetical protein